MKGLGNDKAITILVYTVRYYPIIVAISIFLNIISSLFNSTVPELLDLFLGQSLLSLFLIFISCKVYRFCFYQMTLIAYDTICLILFWIAYKIGIPLETNNLICFYLVITFLCLLVILFNFFFRKGDRTNIYTKSRINKVKSK